MVQVQTKIWDRQSLVIDLTVRAKSLNCEDRSCYDGNPRDFFLADRSEMFIHASFAKVDVNES